MGTISTGARQNVLVGTYNHLFGPFCMLCGNEDVLEKRTTGNGIGLGSDTASAECNDCDIDIPIEYEKLENHVGKNESQPILGRNNNTNAICLDNGTPQEENNEDNAAHSDNDLVSDDMALVNNKG